MALHFISGTEFRGIDVGIGYKTVLALAKAINLHVRVICRVNFKTVKMYENSIIQLENQVIQAGRDCKSLPTNF
jgi:hypothetical protein